MLASSPSDASSISFSENEPQGFDLLDLILPLVRAKLSIALWTCIFAVAGLIVAFIVRPVYTATAVIMPPQQQSSAASAVIGQLGALGSLGAASSLGLKNPADMYVGILQSRLIADSLIDRYHLQQVYKAKLRSSARTALRQDTEFEAAKDGLIYIRVKEHSPTLAADLANAYVDALHQTNARLAIGEAAQRRLFYDQQLADERVALNTAEDDLKTTQQKTGMIQLNGQAEMTIRNIAALRAQIASRQVELGVTRTFATDQNPDVTRLQQEIASLNGQLSSLENSQRSLAPGDIEVPTGQVPAASLEYLRKLREVRYHESLFELLAKQREAASLDEAKSAPLIQVVDPAEAPERKSGPSRILIVLGFAVFGCILGAARAIIQSVLATLRRSPEQAERLAELQRAIRLRKA